MLVPGRKFYRQEGMTLTSGVMTSAGIEYVEQKRQQRAAGGLVWHSFYVSSLRPEVKGGQVENLGRCLGE